MHLITASPETKSVRHFETFVIPNRAESPVRACPELAEGNLLSARATTTPSLWGFGSDTTGKGTTSVVPQA